MTLDRQVYGKVRRTVLDKLGDKAEQFVADLDLTAVAAGVRQEARNRIARAADRDP